MRDDHLNQMKLKYTHLFSRKAKKQKKKGGKKEKTRERISVLSEPKRTPPSCPNLNLSLPPSLSLPLPHLSFSQFPKSKKVKWGGGGGVHWGVRQRYRKGKGVSSSKSSNRTTFSVQALASDTNSSLALIVKKKLLLFSLLFFTVFLMRSLLLVYGFP